GGEGPRGAVAGPVERVDGVASARAAQLAGAGQQDGRAAEEGADLDDGRRAGQRVGAARQRDRLGPARPAEGAARLPDVPAERAVAGAVEREAQRGGVQPGGGEVAER